jgi:hypothetical protein
MSFGRIASLIGACVIGLIAATIADLSLVQSQAFTSISFVWALLGYGVGWFVLFALAAAVIGGTQPTMRSATRPIWRHAVAFGVGGAVTAMLVVTLFFTGLVARVSFLARPALASPFILPWVFGLMVQARLTQ